MPTAGQVLTRAQPPRPDRFALATIVATGKPATVRVDLADNDTTAYPLATSTVYAINDRVLIVMTSGGAYILGRVYP